MSVCLECRRSFGTNELSPPAFRREWMHFFCSETCRDIYAHQRLTNRTCSREECNNKVPEENRMLCLDCYNNETNIGERVAFLLDAKGRAVWEEREQAIRLRIREKVIVYSAQDMTQEELRALVPSQQEEVV